MTENLIIGTKKKFEVDIDGLDYLYLSDSDVNFTVHFYVNGKHSQKCVEVAKSNCTFVYEDGSTDSNKFHVVCDTTGFPTGSLVVVVMITYPDIDTNSNLTENVEWETNIDCVLRNF